VRGSDLLGEVELRIDSLIGHLEHAIDDLHDSIGTQRDLMHAVAHEFRGPIARLRFASDLVAETDNADDRAELLRKIDRAVQELDELVSEVLGYSRIRHGGYRLKLDSIELGPLMAQVLTKVRAEYPSIDFRLSPENSPGQVRVDPKLLERAVINLARNAGRFARRQVDIVTRIDDQQFEIRISDDGPGIAPGKRERIFEPFTRLDASRSRESGGSGLGLAIVMAVSNQHQGTIRCGDSSLGGAEFTLKWPVSTPP
jgi:two-component system sensor histidine kinase RstB